MGCIVLYWLRSAVFNSIDPGGGSSVLSTIGTLGTSWGSWGESGRTVRAIQQLGKSSTQLIALIEGSLGGIKFLRSHNAKQPTRMLGSID